MSNCIEYKDRMVFHPGYYIKELVDTSGLTQEDFAKRLDTTPKNLSVLIRGEQSLSIDMATKLSRITDVSVTFWLNTQQNYDVVQAEMLSEEISKKENVVFENINVDYFVENFHIAMKKVDSSEKMNRLRKYLRIASLLVLRDDTVLNQEATSETGLEDSAIVNSNAIIQVAMNEALDYEASKFDKRKLSRIARKVGEIESAGSDVVQELKSDLAQAGVVLVVLPNMKETPLRLVTKRLAGKRMVMAVDKEENPTYLLDTVRQGIERVMENKYGVVC